MKKILFTGGGGAGSEAIYRLLSPQYEVYFADADIETISDVIPKDHCHQILYADDLKFIDHLDNLCNKYSIDLVVPSVDEELLKIVDLDTPAMLPEHEYIKIMLDKFNSAKTISNANLDSPKTIKVSSFLQGNSFSFPCIIKPRKGRGSRNVKILNRADQVVAYLLLTEMQADDVILQELIIGQEYTVLMGADSEKNLKLVIPVKVGIKRGITLRAEIVNNEIVDAACRAIHKAFPARGCYNIQLILTDDGIVMPFEINPRISTTFCMSLAYGVNPINIFYNKIDSGLEKIGSKLKRSWINEFY